jgi:hypothetical protein
LIAVLVLGVTAEATRSAFDWVSRSVLVASSFDSLIIRLAALAALLGRFVGLAIIYFLVPHSAFLIPHFL